MVRSPRLVALMLLALVTGACADAVDVPISVRPAPRALGPASTGTLAIAFHLPAPTRRYALAAVVADVATLAITVRTGARAVAASRKLARAQWGAGSASARFDALSTGAYQVEIVALDASGASIGRVTQAASVSAGKVTALQAHLKLDPTASAVGGLALEVALEDGDPAPTPTPASPAGPATPFPDTTDGIHAFAMFDYRLPFPVPAEVAGRIDALWGGSLWCSLQYCQGEAQNRAPGLVAAHPGMSAGLYMPMRRDEYGHKLDWFQANHPDWILYKADGTPAYEFGSPNVPLATWKPEVQRYLIDSVVVPGATKGFTALSLDNVLLNNAFGAVGSKDENGQLVRRYSGDYADPRWLADQAAWARVLVDAAHAQPHPLQVIGNLYPLHGAEVRTADGDAVLAALDGVVDEGGVGFDHVPDAASWGRLIDDMRAIQARGKAYLLVNAFLDPARVPREQLQYGLASYLMGKDRAAYLFTTHATMNGPNQDPTIDYGGDNPYPEYDAKIGTPLEAMQAIGDTGALRRIYSHGVAFVNPPGNPSVSLGADPNGPRYVDLYGQPVSHFTLPAGGGLVLLTSPS